MSSINTMDIFNEVVGRHMGGQLIPVTRFGSTMQTFTPQWVVKDMIALLPDQVWNEHTTFLDISCKTGIFLVEIFKKLDEVLSKNPKYADTATRRSHILNEQLYGLALDDKECLWYSSRNVYGRIGAKNMKYLHAGGYSYDQLVKNKKVEYMKALIQEEFGRNMFDVVVGNPPYNNDIYLDFVTLAKAIQTQNVCMITPAKWQAKGGPKNEAFRKEIVPYMSKIVYYPDCKEVFDIKIQGGVAYYLCSKVSTATVVINRCKKNSKLNSCVTRTLTKDPLLLNAGTEIMKKVNMKTLNRVRCESSDKYGVYIINAYMQGALMLNTGNTLLLGNMYVEDNSNPVIGQSDVMIFSANDIDICKSFISYVSTKFIRFLAFMLIDGQQPKFNNIWKNVPDPGAFDHIFTDQELYKKYNLTDEEINIIESVIKERK